MTEQSALYQLIYQGPADDSLRTLQKIKGVFVADLELTIPEIQNILANCPQTVRSAESEGELKNAYQLLKSAGAKVLIVSPQAAEPPPETTEAPADNHPSQNSTNQADANPPEAPAPEQSSIRDQSNEVAFELVLEEKSAAPDKSEVKPEKVYTLEIDNAQNAPLLDLQAAAEPPAASSPADSSADTTRSANNPLAFMLEGAEVDAFLDKKTDQPSTTPTAAEVSGEFQPPPAKDQVSSPESTATPPSELEQQPAAPLAEFEKIAFELENESPKAVPDPTTAESRPETNLINELAELELANEPDAVAVITAPAPDHEVIPEPEKPIVSEAPEAQQAAVTDQAPPEAQATPAETAPVETPKTDLQASAPGSPGLATTATPQIFVNTSAALSVSKPKAKSRNKYLLEILVPVLVGSSILAAANWYYFSPPRETDDLDSAGSWDANEMASGESANYSDSVPAAPQQLHGLRPGAFPSGTDVFEAKDSDLNRELTAAFASKKAQLESATVLVTTLPPPPLTKEEIVAGKTNKAWLRKLQAVDIPFESGPAGTFTGQGPVLAYIEYHGQQRRVIGSIAITAHFAAEQKTVAASLTIKSKDITVQPETPFRFEGQPNGSFSFYISASLTAAPAAAN